MWKACSFSGHGRGLKYLGANGLTLGATAAGSLALVVLLFRSRDRLLVKVVRFCGHEKIVAV